jgi:protein TonB
MEYQNHYTEKGQLSFHAFYDKASDSWLGENYDGSGKRTPGFFTYQVQAKFPGGPSAWQNYLATHLKADVPTRHKAPVGLYTVVVTFLVNKEGKIEEVQAANDPGYGTAEEAVRVIKNGPLWIAAEQNGKKVIYKQKQSITFQVSKE